MSEGGGSSKTKDCCAVRVVVMFNQQVNDWQCALRETGRAVRTRRPWCAMRSAVGFVGDSVGQSMWLTGGLVRCVLWMLQMLRNRVAAPIG